MLKTKLFYPVNITYRISRSFKNTHRAIDFATPIGTPVYGSQDGVVQWIKDEGKRNYGKSVWVIHCVNNEKFMTIYAHLNDIHVKIDDCITPDIMIGLSGNTGNSGGPHLHFEVRNSHSRWSSPIDFYLVPYRREIV